MNGTRALVLVLVALVLIDLSWTAAVDNRADSVAERVDGVAEDQERLAAFAGANATLDDGTQVTASLYAYDSAASDGVVVPATVTPIPADGRYLNVGNVAHTATVQASIETAWTVANRSEYPPSHRGVVVDIETPADWDTVGGGSAALAFSLAFTATNECVDRRDDVAVTGGLTSEGTVVEVDHVEAKARAARARNVSTFVVPDGQAVVVEGIDVVPVSTYEAAADVALSRSEQCANETLRSRGRLPGGNTATGETVGVSIGRPSPAGYGRLDTGTMRVPGVRDAAAWRRAR